MVFQAQGPLPEEVSRLARVLSGAETPDAATRALDEVSRAFFGGQLELDQLLGCNAQQRRILHKVALGYLARRQCERAVGVYALLMVLRPKDAEAWRGIGRALLLGKRVTDAATILSVALEALPEEPVLLFDRGEVLLRLGREEEAVADLERGLELALGRRGLSKESGRARAILRARAQKCAASRAAEGGAP